MLGFRKRNDQAEAQIPYEVYETVHRPSAVRQWTIRLVAALLAVTLIIFAMIWLSHRLLGDGPDKNSGSSAQSGQQDTQGSAGGGPTGQDGPKPSDSLNQSPTQNTQVPGDAAQPVTVPQSGTKNDSTVRKPE